ncbi:hypothetical protein OIU74_028397 [Salix koriyanagi]|uniref:Uncharacterized protein n=1 Tax=Salix koriyanagi TaxID=2511006 RepID=A0A9Q0VCI1_9ROSI|nr:hypothetical protein OIU74_028397 [Salix koriyanagi]
MNRSCSRENPDILIVMIAERQMMKCGEDDQEREIMGPQKPAREMSDTALKRNSLPPPPSLPPVLVFTLVWLFSLQLASGILDNIVSPGAALVG